MKEKFRKMINNLKHAIPKKTYTTLVKQEKLEDYLKEIELNATKKAKYKIIFEKGRTICETYTDDFSEAKNFAMKKAIISDHQINIIDTSRNLVVLTLY